MNDSDWPPLAGGPVEVLANGYFRRFVADGDTYFALVGSSPIAVTRIEQIPTN
jgi:hypothetical protein